MNDFSILQVPPSEFVARWDVVEPLIAAALPVTIGRYIPLDVLVMLITGQAQGWFIKEADQLQAVLVSRVDQFPRRRCLTIWALAGRKMDEWFETADEILTAYARQNGCDHIEVQGRKGWQRYLGHEPRSTFLVKDLTENKDGGAMI